MLANSTSLESLKKWLLEDWFELAPDALAIVESMSEESFIKFRVGLKKECAGKFAGQEFVAKYGVVMMPSLMFEASIAALHYHVPWGLAFIRLQEQKIQ